MGRLEIAYGPGSDVRARYFLLPGAYSAAQHLIDAKKRAAVLERQLL
jgi:hypothetical protein